MKVAISRPDDQSAFRSQFDCGGDDCYLTALDHGEHVGAIYVWGKTQLEADQLAVSIASAMEGKPNA